MCNTTCTGDKVFHFSPSSHCAAVHAFASRSREYASVPLPHGWGACGLRIPPWPQGWGFLAAASSLLRLPFPPSRCALGPPPGPGASLHHSPAISSRHCQIYLPSNWRVTVHLHTLVPNVTWDPLPTQRGWSVSAFLGLILTGTRVSPKENTLSTHTQRHLHAAGARAGQASQQVVPLPEWDCTHSCSLSLWPFTMAVVCLQRKDPHKAANFLCRDIPAYLSMGEQQRQRPGSAW